MDDRAELDEGLILYPPVGVIEAPFEELDAFGYPLNVIIFKMFHEAGEVLDADFPYAPNIVVVKLLEGTVVDFIQEHLMSKVL